MADAKLVVREDGRVLPEDRAAANQHPPDVEATNEDPGPVPAADAVDDDELPEPARRRRGSRRG